MWGWGACACMCRCVVSITMKLYRTQNVRLWKLLSRN